jgi:hypothetical protein
MKESVIPLPKYDPDEENIQKVKAKNINWKKIV